jgi:tetratricopeptide (TPR) repeat protein
MPLAASAEGTGPPPGQPLPNTGPVLDQKLTVGDITISYPKGLESQARELMAVCEQVIPPRKAKYLAAAWAFSDQKAVAERVADLLGCPDWTDTADRLTAALAPATETLVETLFLPMLSDVRIYREADLKLYGGLHTGVADLTYDPNTDLFTFRVGLQVTDKTVGAPAQRGFLPELVRDDGTFRMPPGLDLAEWVAQRLDELAVGTAIAVRAAAIHEAAEAILVEAGCDHPFTRWFNEGAATWVALQVVAQVAPEHLQLCREHFLPGRAADPIRERINLLAWTQLTHEREFVLAGESGLSEAHYPYATELIDRLLQEQPAGTLAKVVRELRGSQSPDTDAICKAFREVTGKDARSMLLEYVPIHVRDGLAQGLAATKLQEGYQALSAGQLPRAATLLKEALEMSPSDADAHLNLAIVMRRSLQGSPAPSPRTEQRPWQESQRHLAIAAALAKRDPSRQFQMHGSVDDEARYAFGRAEQFRGRIKEAKDILSKLPQDHEDAQSALREIAEEEGAPAPRPADAASERQGQGFAVKG